MIHIRHAMVSAAVMAAGLLIAGCPPKNQTTLNPPPDTRPAEAMTASEVRGKVTDLKARVAEYVAAAKNLPGKTEPANRTLATQQFMLLAQILPLLGHANAPGDFRQQLLIIESSRAQLSSAPVELASEPTVGTGLRAAWRALSQVNRESFTEVPDVAKALDTMKQKIDELDALEGPMHRWVAAQAFQASADAITHMTATLDQRVSELPMPKPADKPADKPANKPADKPEAEKPAQTKPAEPPVEKPAEKPATPPVEKPAEKPAPTPTPPAGNTPAPDNK